MHYAKSQQLLYIVLNEIRVMTQLKIQVVIKF